MLSWFQADFTSDYNGRKLDIFNTNYDICLYSNSFNTFLVIISIGEKNNHQLITDRDHSEPCSKWALPPLGCVLFYNNDKEVYVLFNDALNTFCLWLY